MVNVMLSSFLTLTTPPTEMGVMPKSVCLTTNVPVAVNRSPEIFTATGAATVCVLPRIVSLPVTDKSSLAADPLADTPVLSNVMVG